jgi:hypothetical protein
MINGRSLIIIRSDQWPATSHQRPDSGIGQRDLTTDGAIRSRLRGADLYLRDHRSDKTNP